VTDARPVVQDVHCVHFLGMYSSIISELRDYAHEELGFDTTCSRQWNAHFGFPQDTIASMFDRYDPEMGHPINETMPYLFYLKNYPTWDVLQSTFPRVLHNYDSTSALLKENQRWLATMDEVIS